LFTGPGTSTHREQTGLLLISVYIQKAGNADEITRARSVVNAGWTITTHEPFLPLKKFIVSEMKEAV
jgi:hypothetical protein